MKKIIFIVIYLGFLLGCKEEHDIIDLTLSSNNVSFAIKGGETQVEVVTEAPKWDFLVSENWLLIRRTQNTLFLVAEENIGEERDTQVDILYRGKVIESITVIQEGIQLNIEKSEIDFTSAEESKTISITANADWDIIACPEWCIPSIITDGIQIQVARNYSTKQRDGEIEITSGEILKKIKLIQNGCNWYESFDMVFVNGGSFMMGAQKTDISGTNYDSQAYQIESPIHKVTVSDYYICKFEVTQAQWQAAMGNNPSETQGENLPVTSVSWEETQNFISKLNAITGKEYCLPTEAEWEFAARGGNLSQGYKYSGSSVLGACAWFYSNSNSALNVIGTKESNELYIYDMSGNVREWCNDWFDYYTTSAAINPLGPSSGNMKINRGGSWSTPDVNCRNTYRHTDYSQEKAHDLGFRIAMKIVK